MSMLLELLGPWLGGFVAFLLLLFASWSVGEGGEILGKKYDASIVGGLLIAWLNTAPETIFFITALESNNPRFAIGAMSGSTIVVSTVAMGACYYFGTVSRKSNSFIVQPQVKRQCLFLLCSSVIPFAIAIFGFDMLIGGFGVVSYLLFVIMELLKTKSPPTKDHDIEEGMASEESSEEEEQNILKGVGYLVIGGSLIGLCSEPFISAIVQISMIAQVNPILLAFFLAPVASEMPEILESISLSRKGKIQNINIAVSNLTGGTISKTTLLCGILCYYGVKDKFHWEHPNYSLSLFLMGFCALVSAATGAMIPVQVTWHSFLLMFTFFVAALIQFFYNSTYSEN